MLPGRCCRARPPAYAARGVAEIALYRSGAQRDKAFTGSTWDRIGDRGGLGCEVEHRADLCEE